MVDKTVRAVVWVTLLVAVLQIASTVGLSRGLESPNYTTNIARSLAAGEGYQGGDWWRLRGPDNPPPPEPLRFFHLPASPYYQAAWMTFTPPMVQRFLQLPVTLLWFAASTYVIARALGSRVALIGGVVGAIQPFIILHGPVWDDAFLGTALQWALFALLVWRVSVPSTNKQSPERTVIFMLLVAITSGACALARTGIQPLLVLVMIAAFVVRPLRRLRVASIAALLGAVLAMVGWGVRNQIVVGSFEMGSSHDGITLWESVYPSATEALWTRGQTERLNAERMTAQFRETAGMSEADANRYFSRLGTQYVLHHPLRVAGDGLQKALVSITGISPEMSWKSPRNLIASASNLSLVAAAIVGMFVLWRSGFHENTNVDVRTTVKLLAIGTGLVTLVMLMLGPAGARYRIAVDPFLWAAVGAAIVGCRDCISHESNPNH